MIGARKHFQVFLGFMLILLGFSHSEETVEASEPSKASEVSEEDAWEPCKQVPKGCKKKTHKPVDLEVYYEDAEERYGAALRNNLHIIISEDHHVYNYNQCTWKALAEIDADPNAKGHVVDVYTRRSIPNLRRDCRENKNDGNAWVRHPVWPKKFGILGRHQIGNSDLHHLRAMDKSLDQDTSNFFFASGGEFHPECSGCRWNETAQTFEPPDVAKGEIARILLYMDIRYEGDEESSSSKNLILQDDVLGPESPMGVPEFGRLSDVLDWHCRFPVSDWERARNDKIYQWQGNRNPFVDHPEYAFDIWEDFACDNLQAHVAHGIAEKAKQARIAKLTGVLTRLSALERDVREILCEEGSKEHCDDKSQLSEGARNIMNQFLNSETPPVEAEHGSKTANQEIRNYLNQQKSSSGNNPTRAAGDGSYYGSDEL